jgi:hypothetical protein
MSKLIQQLAEQAKSQVPQGILSPELWIEQYNQRFAELIVRECVLISRTSTDGFSAGRRMEEHFGVK